MKHALSGHPVRALVIACLVTAGVRAQSRSYSDGNFSNWTSVSMGTSGASASMAIWPTGGNPGSYIAATIDLSGPDETGCLAMINNSAVWDPAIDGPVCLIRLGLDVQSVTGWGQGQWLRPLVAQNGQVFVAPGGNTGASVSWHRVHFDPFPAVAFMAVWPPDPAAHPDFSAGGSPLTLGFAVINASTSNGGYRYIQNYDNWHVVVHRGDPAQRHTMGTGCGSTRPTLASGLPVLGAGVGLSVTGAPPNRGGGLFAGVPASAPWPIGPRCHVYLDPSAVLFVAAVLRTDAAGRWSSRLVFPPDPGLSGLVFALQAAVFPTPTPVGLDLTNGLFLQIGG